ncbi:1-acyl-sn-glycerol-3-phosphate acyltransferase [Lacihabitans soyangensis]|uniref:Glycerol acyltransferase n=1 Tax=Lacihabitans soyangensis TaxID=869394 RepID=A0AAE3H0Q3_9BACT|nr:1-acyl-sn-glycerol-3-phosphate acyltransferase [Lacihabitans soyangensis]MCP9762155.1 glycerol acyltransferase [Lacihabitans soyangensis]
MIYIVLRQFIRFVLRFFIKKIEINGMENLPKEGAVLLAGFHPNSFLDAIIIDCKVNRPIWSLARGDAFKKPLVRKILSKFYMMPIYRITEGKEYLGKNDETFERCSEIFKNKSQVLIFSEGLCTNQTELLPLKKGTSRLAMQTWMSGTEMVIVPVAINYSEFAGVGKNISLNFGPAIKQTDFEELAMDGKAIRTFNEKLTEALKKLVRRDFKKPTLGSSWFYYLTYVLHFPVHLLLHTFVKSKTRGTVFYDSIYLGLLIVALPLYWLLCYFIFQIFI